MFRRFSVRLELSTDLDVYAPENATEQEVEEAARSIAEGSWSDYRDWFEPDLEFSVHEHPRLSEKISNHDNAFALHDGEFVHPDDAPWTRVVIQKPPEPSEPSVEDDRQITLPL